MSERRPQGFRSGFVRGSLEGAGVRPAAFTPGKRPEPEKPKPKEGLLEKLRKAEQQLASIKDSDENAKWTLARMRSKQLFMDTNDTDYWICICFESRAQKQAFLRASGLEDPEEDKYFSGMALARSMKIPLAEDRRAFHTLSVNQRWAPYALPAPGRGTGEGGSVAAPVLEGGPHGCRSSRRRSEKDGTGPGRGAQGRSQAGPGRSQKDRSSRPSVGKPATRGRK